MYRVEIYDMYNRTSVSAFMLDKSTKIEEDYMSPKVFDIAGPADITCEVRNTIAIMDGTTRLWSGFIKAVQRTRQKTTITVSPLALLLNDKSIQTRYYSDYRKHINWQIYSDYNAADRSLYSVPFFRYSNSPTSNWDGVLKPFENSAFMNDLDVVLLARKTYGKFMSFGVNNGAGWLGVPHYGFKKFTTTKTIEADLENIISKDIRETSDGGYNIAKVWVVSENNPYQYGYYTVLLINGDLVIGSARQSEITEPRMVAKVYTEYRTFTTDELKDVARQMLKPTADNYTIELTLSRDDTLVRPVPWSYGQPTNIIANGKTYQTYYTGRTLQGDLITMKFGMARTDLTALMNTEELEA